MILAYEINPTTFVPARFGTIGSLMNVVLPLMSIGASLIFLAMILYGAFTYITNGDNPEGIKKANSTIIFAGMGLLIVIISFVAVRLLGVLLGINNILP